MKPQIRQALFVSGVTVLLMAGLGLLATASQAGEFKRFPDYAYEGEQDVDVKALKELLRQAHELRKAEDKAGAAEAQDVVDEAKATAKQADANAAAAKRGSPAQAGCMYRDEKLIWERKPGACAP